MGRESRKQIISDINKQNIISAAEELFFLKGYEKTTMDDISQKSEYSKRTVYAYFKSKEEIYHHLILKGFIMLKHYISDSLSKDETHIDKYLSVCNSMKDFYINSPKYFDMIIQFQNKPIDFDSPSDVILEIYTIGEEINTLIEEFTSDAQKNGVVKKNLNPKKISFVFWSCLSGLVAIANNKSVYIKNAMGETTDEFLSFGFELLLSSILEEKYNGK